MFPRNLSRLDRVPHWQVDNPRAPRPKVVRPLLLLFILLCLLGPVPAFAQLQIHFDYSYDTSGFFSGTSGTVRRADLDAAAAMFESRMTSEQFAAVTPAGQNTLSLQIYNPSTGNLVTLDNPALAPNTLTVYVGARELGGTTLGLGAGAAFGASGSQSWIDLLNSRDNTTNYDPFGGSISFDINSSWYFDPDPSSLESFAGLYDFYSVVQHELGHVLGFASDIPAFNADISGSNFVGVAAEALYGGAVPLAPDLSHWAQGVTSGGQEVTMDPSISANLRKNFTPLDFAALRDIGYQINAIPEPSSACLAFIGLAGLAFPVLKRRRTGVRF